MFATAVLSSTGLPHAYISPGSCRPTIDNNPWKVSGTVDEYMDLFRFQRDDIITVMSSFRLINEQNGEYKTFRLGEKIVNGRLPSRYHVLIRDWGMYPSHMSNVFNHMIKYLYRKFALQTMRPSRWANFFADFAQQFIEWDSPYKNLAMLVDGNFLYTLQ